MHRYKKLRRSGFSLIEILVVVSIIALLAVVIGVVVPGGGISLSGGQLTLTGLVKSARGTAVLRGAKTRLIIYAEDQPSGMEPEKILRFVGIVYADEDESGNEKWVAATEGDYLPDEIYFNHELSTAGAGKGTPSKDFNIPYPRSKPVGENEDGSATWYYYEFNGNGSVTENSGAKIIVSTGQRELNQGTNLVEVTELSEDQIAGFILNRSGTVMIATDPEDLK